MITDMHTHTHWSSDSITPLKDHIESAISKGMKSICITDHQDFDAEPFAPDYFTFLLNDTGETEPYINEILEYKELYKDKIEVLLGIELGMQPHLINKLNDYSLKYPFDFIIGSTHRFDKLDAEDKRHYESVSIQEACEHYFEQELLNLKGFKNCDAVGHMDFVLRYCPGAVEYFSYSKFADVLDEILREIINSGRGLECNTSKFVAKNMINPNLEIFKRYFELGGEIVTFGSDAHTPNRIGEGFNEISEKLKSIGLKYYAVYRNHVPEFLKV